MVEIQNIFSYIFQLLQLADIFHFTIPFAGVGGGIDAKEHVQFVQILKSTLIFLAGIGVIFGLGLALAARRFSVKINPRVEQVKDVLAHAHCGACGFAGCEQYAEAVVNNPDVPPNLCTPGGKKTAEAVAFITGKKPVIREPVFARVMCKGGSSKSKKRFTYEGVQDCRAAILAGGGDKACRYGCLGYGTCSRVCPFGAITMTNEHLPHVDITKCNGCRKCEAACPVKVIEVLPASKNVLVTCHSHDKRSDTRSNCQAGCIACGICVKVCPFDAPYIESNLSRINLDKCNVCGLCVRKCPTKAISDFIPERPKAHINDNCNGCHICYNICPVDAISGDPEKKHSIDQTKCTGCGICTSKCPAQAIEGTFNAPVVSDVTGKISRAA
jgi:electron transport complex protein RnfB